MNGLEFILGIIITIFVFVSIIGGLSIKYDSERLEKENKELKEKLSRRNKREFNKAKKEEKK